ncbi:MAG: hypothetical protein AB1631_27905, partial [Acidobacteriota bacterium]
MKLSFVVFLSVFLLAQQLPVVNSNAHSQSSQAAEADVRTIEAGKPIQREIKIGETHIYAINLKSGQYANVEVQEQGAEVRVRMTGPDGKMVSRPS